MATVRRMSTPHPPQVAVVGAFAYERDALAAAGLLVGAPGIDARFVLHPVQGEDGVVQMVLLEVDLPTGCPLARVRAAITGAHGVCLDVLPPEVVGELARH